MSLVDKWNRFARKNLYINNTFEIGCGRLVYMIVLNCFIMMGMLFSGTNAQSIAWLWVDMIASLKQKEKN